MNWHFYCETKFEIFQKYRREIFILDQNCRQRLYSTGLVESQLKMKHFCDEKICSPGYYLCYHISYCIPIDLVCNGISDCYLGDDEFKCGENVKILITKIKKYFLTVFEQIN